MNTRFILPPEPLLGRSKIKYSKIENYELIAYASSHDIVILSNDLQIIHIINVRNEYSNNTQRSSDKDFIVEFFEFSTNGKGEIVVGYENFISIYMPYIKQKNNDYDDLTTSEPVDFNNRIDIYKLEWKCFYTFNAEVKVSTCIFGNMEMLSHISDEYMLSANDNDMYFMFIGSNEGISAWKVIFQSNKCDFSLLWRIKTNPIKIMKLSQDGRHLATCGFNEKFIKVWYLFRSNERNSESKIRIPFSYLFHPRSVEDFEWKKVFAEYSCNALLSHTRSGIVFVWEERSIDQENFNNINKFFLRVSLPETYSMAKWICPSMIYNTDNEVSNYDNDTTLFTTIHNKLNDHNDWIIAVKHDGTISIWKISGIGFRISQPIITSLMNMKNALICSQKDTNDIIQDFFIVPQKFTFKGDNYQPSKLMLLTITSNTCLLSQWSIEVSVRSQTTLQNRLQGYKNKILDIASHPLSGWISAIDEEKAIIWKCHDPGLSDYSLNMQLTCILPKGNKSKWDFYHPILYVYSKEKKVIDAYLIVNFVHESDISQKLLAKVNPWHSGHTLCSIPVNTSTDDDDILFTTLSSKIMNLKDNPHYHHKNFTFLVVISSKGCTLELWKIYKTFNPEQTININTELVSKLHFENDERITSISSVNSIERRSHREILSQFSLLTGHENGYIYMWQIDYENDEFKLKKLSSVHAHDSSVLEIKYSSTERIATYSKDSDIKIWEHESSFPNLRLEDAIPLNTEGDGRKKYSNLGLNIISNNEYDNIRESKNVDHVSFEWITFSRGILSLVLSKNNSTRFWTLKSPSNIFDHSPKWKFIHSIPLSASKLTFSHQGQVFMVSENHMKIFLETVTLEFLLPKVEKGITSLPFYHPKILIDLLIAGRLDVFSEVLILLYKTLKENPESKQYHIKPPQLYSTPTESESDNSIQLDDAIEKSESHETSQNDESEEESSSLEDDFFFTKTKDPFSVSTQPQGRFGFEDVSWNIDEKSESEDEKEEEIEVPVQENTHGIQTIDWSFESLTKSEKKELRKLLKRAKLYGMDQYDIDCLISLIKIESQIDKSWTDLCAIKFVILARYYFELKKNKVLNCEPRFFSFIWCWGLHAFNKSLLINETVPNESMDWNIISSLGIPLWCDNIESLRNVCKTLCQTIYLKTKDPNEVALFYILLDKVTALSSLYKLSNNDQDKKVADFLKKDFTEQRWNVAAKKNGFVLMGKQKFKLAITFFLLAGELQDALNICIKNLSDPMLAIFISRVYKSGSEKQAYINCLNNILEYAQENEDIILHSMIKWILKDYTASVECLSPQGISQLENRKGFTINSFHPYLRHYLSLLRKHPTVKHHKIKLNDITSMNSLTTKISYNMLYSGMCRSLIQDAYDGKYLNIKTGNNDLIKKAYILYLCQEIIQSIDNNTKFMLEEYNYIEEKLFNYADKEEILESILHFCDEKHLIKQHYHIFASLDHKQAGQLLIKTAQRITSVINHTKIYAPSQTKLTLLERILLELWQCLDNHLENNSTSFSLKAISGIRASIKLGLLFCSFLTRDYERFLKILKGLYPVKTDYYNIVDNRSEENDPLDSYVELILQLLIVYKFSNQIENELSKCFQNSSSLNIAKTIKKWVLSLENNVALSPISLYKQCINSGSLKSNNSYNLKFLRDQKRKDEYLNDESVKSVWSFLDSDSNVVQYISTLFRDIYHNEYVNIPSKIQDTRNITFSDKTIVLKDKGSIKSFCINSSQSNQFAISISHGMAEFTIHDNEDFVRDINDCEFLDKDERAIWLESHPTLPYYLSANSDGSLKFWQFNMNQPLASYRPPSKSKCMRVRFNWNGSRFAAVDSDGILELWKFDANEESIRPFYAKQCFKKHATDLAFINSGSVLAISGECSDHHSVVLCDTLLPPNRSQFYSYLIEDGYTSSLSYSRANQLLICGTNKGTLNIIDIRARKILKTIDAHLKTIKDMHISDLQNILITGSSDGSVKLWDLKNFNEIECFRDDHLKTATFGKSGVSKVFIVENSFYSCGSDGLLIKRDILKKKTRR